MSNIDKRFALLDRATGEELFPYMKVQKSTNRFGFALTRPGEQDRHGKGHYTTDIREVIKRVVIDGWNVRVKTISRVGKQRDGSLGIGKTANADYWVSPEFAELVKIAPIRPRTALPSEEAARPKLHSKEQVQSPSSTEPFSADGVEKGAQREVSVPSAEQSSFESETRSLKTAEKEAVVKVRYGQGSFRDALVEEKGHGEKCWMSGIEGRQLLVASHIKPWSHCKEDPESRGRPDNGLLLSSLWDAAFDSGIISFDSDWKVIASSMLSETARRALNLDGHSALPEKFRTEGRWRYLAYHREIVFENWNREPA